MLRKPVVAGQFYTASESLLRKELESLTIQKKEKIDAIGVVSPHAGYVYSGQVAGEVLSSVKPKPTYILLGTNHTGYGKPFGLDAERNWKTPLGEIAVDKDLAHIILTNSNYIEKDTLCHDFEHSIEVQLPFLQHLNKDSTIVPIVISHADKKVYKEIGKELACAVKENKKEAIAIASSDMTHYEPHQLAREKDMRVIERILSLDIDGFLDTVSKYEVSMCGVSPTAVMLAYALEWGAKNAKLIKYQTSGDTSGDYGTVVGYAGIVVY